ncbi:sensor histidine kinase [Alteraurantiacibacter aquimixticola]|uniref:histidine kinase n=1 Tax=Alteraurantiacibacter aquimixticola TaxID=2489173 RepID=A0A4T3F5A8_9SPHN|nr:HAMP domain-containing sensor histidine kinase [Alteraurantiacibacter aquimixticola]TIX50006.1 HAMP domain-containing histidine kinase [Alteraurantiacibacter aquimixticola]
MAGQAPFAAIAQTDARNWLVAADEPLAGLQLRNGGELPGAIVTPQLLELVTKARNYGFKLSRAISARDGEELVSAWVEVEPQGNGEGCRITVSDWQSVPVPEEDAQQERARQVAYARQFAELSARLGPEQQLLTVDCDAADLSGQVEAMREGIGKAWTDFVELDGTGHHQPVHWRLLDGATMRLPGSDRHWQALIVPLGRGSAGSGGFELYLMADRPLPDAVQPSNARQKPEEPRRPGLGREIAPVLRQPVSRIIANAETIRTQLAGPLAEEYANYAADIATAGEHLLALIDDLTTLEMVEDEDFAPAPDQIDLSDVARRAVGILGVRAQERGIAVSAPALDQQAPAIGEFRRVLQILLNLLGNAIRYAPEGSAVRLQVGTARGRACITVTDEGEGLSEEEQERAFAKFERLGRSGDGGSGLGLYISRRLAEAMGGSLTVESAKGEGARFTLDLPADPEA